MKRIVLILVLILAFIATIFTPAYAWYGSAKYATPNDVHLTQTYWWAKEMGFDDKSAAAISKECDQVDFGWRILDKTWHLDRSFETGDTMDTRLKHANDEMQMAKDIMAQVPGKNIYMAAYLRKQACEHLGRGLHSMQDYYGHMDAGVGKKVTHRMFRGSHHGMNGVYVPLRSENGEVTNVLVDYLYDDVCYDYTVDEGWHRHASKEECSRWINTRDKSKGYLYEFLIYGYGPSK